MKYRYWVPEICALLESYDLKNEIDVQELEEEVRGVQDKSL